MAPITLTGTAYNETFDGIGATLPPGWDIYTGANASSLGASTTFTTTPVNWNNTSGGFKNFAAGDSLPSTATTTDQSAASDRALGIRQTGAFGDPGGSFVFSLNNTSGFQNFGLSFKAQMLDVQPRSTTWTVDYKVGNSSNFTPLGTYTDPGVFGSTTLSTGSGLSAFGTDINDQSNPVQVRISALSPSTGSGSRDSFGIDDFQLTYSATGTTTPPTTTPPTTTPPTTSPTITKIHDIQGNGSVFNPAFGGTQTIEGIVVAAFPGSTGLNGFFVEEEDADADTDPTTSEGIFIYDPNAKFSGKVGDKVQVTGTVSELTTTSNGINSSLTEITTTSVLNEGASTLPTPINIKLPVTNVADLERYEGMLVNVSAASGNLTVTEQFQLGRFGQVTLAATGATNQPGTDARIDQYTQFNAPSVSGYSAYQNEVAKRQIILDDGRATQNPDPIIFGDNGNPLSATNTLRGGDSVASITGILDERFDGYRIQTSSPVNFTSTNPRPTAAPNVGGTLKVAALNVLNFFTDLDTGSNITVPNGVTFEPRGANNSAEFTRQRNKIVNSIIAINADVVGVMEMENNGSTTANSAIANLVSGLNAVAGAGTYAFIDDTNLVNDPNPQPNAVGTDAIKVALIYKPGSVTPVLAQPLSYAEPNPSNPIFSRPPIAETFQQNSNGEKFSIIVNHFKSKSASGASGLDLDQGDGQGAYNDKRSRQATAMNDFVNTVKAVSGDNDVMIVGDLNAYAKEDPITILGAAGNKSLLSYDSYSYVFDGDVGSLDYTLANDSLRAQVTGAAKFHNNADEPIALDYNTEFKSANQVSSLYANDFYRASDHDPAVVGLNLFTVNNTLTGSDRTPVAGTTGNDRITGNPGAKTVTGGGGSDQFVFNSIKDAGQTIADFILGSDKIVLTNLLNSLVPGGYKGGDALADGYVQIVQGSSSNSANSILQIDRDGPLGSAIFRPFAQINNISATALNNVNNFVF